MHVVSLNKGPFVLAFWELSRRAAEKGVALKLSGATAAALPTVDIATYCLAGATISKILGILNGTSNYILTRMEAGLTFAEALREAQDMGIAERDPSLDVGGWDTANKLLILTNVALGTNLRLEDIEVQGITDITPQDVRAAREAGHVIKLLGQAERDESGVRASVRPVTLPREHPLAAVTGTTKAVHFETDTMGSLTVIGGRSDPRAAAAAALKDIINLATSGQVQPEQPRI
jgi:homoserine dehydrogenase